MGRISGLAAVVVAALALSVAAQAGEADIRGEGLSQTVDCRGGDASVQGNGNRLVFRGDCTGLDLRGNGNNVRIALAERAVVHVEGNGNRISYVLRSGGEPRVTIRGEGDEVTRAD